MSSRLFSTCDYYFYYHHHQNFCTSSLHIFLYYSFLASFDPYISSNCVNNLHLHHFQNFVFTTRNMSVTSVPCVSE